MMGAGLLTSDGLGAAWIGLMKQPEFCPTLKAHHVRVFIVLVCRTATESAC
jgi:hypothetical protein